MVADVNGPAERGHIPQLDGWRGISISLVLAAHLLPLGPQILELNKAAGLSGMCLFFVLSGYLITSILRERPDVKAFLIRRVLRIVPLAWLVLLILAPLSPGDLESVLPRFLFLQNYVPAATTPLTTHFWSLCVEMHFYLGVALLVAVGGPKALGLLPLVAIVFTGLRVGLGVPASTITHFRIDEILAGACLALVCANQLPQILAWPMRRIPPWVWLGLLFVCSHIYSGPLMYLRPYAGALAIGSTLMQAEHWLSRWLDSRVLKYLASVSYALYVIHGPLRTGWFAGGDTLSRYLVRRPLTIALTFGLAHLSTFQWEARWIAFAKRLTPRRVPPMPVPAPASAGRVGSGRHPE